MLTHCFKLVALAALLAAAAPRHCRADDPLRRELAAIAQSVGSLLKGRGQDSIAIGQFTGPATFPTSAGPGIVQVLKEEFEKREIQVKSRAGVGLKGEYLLTKVEVPDSTDLTGTRTRTALAVRIKGTVVDALGEVLVDFTSDDVADVQLVNGELQVDVADEAAVVQIAGVSVAIPTDDVVQEDRDNRILDAVQGNGDPPRVDGTRVFAGPGSPYGIEVLVGQGPTPRAAALEEGLPFVRISRGEVYQIRLINNSQLDAAVRLTIDGLNTFTFSALRSEEDGNRQGRPRYDVWIIPAGKSGVIKGWHKTNELVDSFLITGYAQSAAATLNHDANIGTITAVFSAAWPVDQDPPADEPPTAKGIHEGDATGFGPPVEQVVEEVQRTVGVVRASVSVRYARPK